MLLRTWWNALTPPCMQALLSSHSPPDNACSTCALDVNGADQVGLPGSSIMHRFSRVASEAEDVGEAAAMHTECTEPLRS